MPDLDERFRSFSRTRVPDLWPEIEGREPRNPIEPSSARRVLVAAVALVVAIAGIGIAAVTFGGSTPSTEPASTVTNGRIAFVGFDRSTWQIYSVEPDGTELRQLTHLEAPAMATEPSWSPDGSRMVYVVQEPDPDGGTGRSDIWIMSAEGADPQVITTGPGSSWEPAWSPDGSRIAFTHGSDVYVMTPDGGEVTNLTPDDESLPGAQSDPTWSPDGSSIAFVNRGADDDLYVMRSDGSAVRTLFRGPGYQSELAWSSDGSTIAFANVTEESGSDVGDFTLIDTSGSTVGHLSGLPAVAQAPAWSPDGRQIVFMANIAGTDREAIFLMDVDGTGIHQITGLPRDASWPAWQPIPGDAAPEPPGPVVSFANGPIYFRVGGGEGGSRIEAVEPDGSGRYVVFAEGNDVHHERISFSPDGTRIAFDNYLVGEYGIETANPDGTDVVRLTDGVNDSWASWSPDGTRILFSSTRYDPSIEGCEPGFPHEYRCPTDIYVMDVDGSNVVRLTDDPAGEFMPRWSPDGGRIAFVREGDLGAGTYEAIYTMRPDGSNVRQVSSGDRGSDLWPSWSPDGSQIAFAAIRAEDWGIWVVGADGSNERLILGGTGAGYVDNPVWSPDGTLIAFVGNLTVDDYSSEDALYVMRPNGTSVTPIADAPGTGVAGDIAWQPITTEQTSPVTPTPPESTSVSEPIPIESSPGAVSALTYGFGSMWVASFDDSMEGWITRLDPGTGEQLARISTGEVFPTWEIGGGGLAVGSDSVWLAGAARAPGEPGGTHAFVSRIDPGSNDVVDTIDLGSGSAADVVQDPSGVWVLSFSVIDQGPATMVVTHIDPQSGGVVETIPLDATYGHHIFAVQGFIVAETNAVHDDTVAGTLLNIIDPSTDSVTRVPLGNYAGTAAGDAALWALSGESIASIDPGTGEILSTWATLNTGDAAAVGAGGIWFLDPSHGRSVRRFDPIKGEVDLSVDIGSGPTPIAMAVAPESIWVLNYEGTVTRVGLTPSP